MKLASVIEQIDVMRTEIKDIATYITVEHKIEKDLREDRLFEEQDAKQKKEMKDRVLAKGEQVPKTAKGEAPQEESKGGGFFSGLMKIVGGLGKEPPEMITTVSVDIDLAREIYERLLSQGWRKTEEFWTKKER